MKRRSFILGAAAATAGVGAHLATGGSASAQSAASKYFRGATVDGAHNYRNTNFKEIDQRWHRQMVKYFSGRGYLVPVTHPRLVEQPEFQGRKLTYTNPRGYGAVLSSSLMIRATANGARRAPEYVHARHQVLPNGRTRDLNKEADVAHLPHIWPNATAGPNLSRTPSVYLARASFRACAKTPARACGFICRSAYPRSLRSAGLGVCLWQL